MKSQTISVQPQIIQIGKQDSQLIKITNNTKDYLENFFFCLYNTQKFEFSPDSFSLAPNQQKIITLKLKLRSVKAVSKQFAYLKSSHTNNRITILVNSFQSPQPRILRTQEEGLQQAHTLSSRGYQETQNAAFNKIIEEKETYILRLQRMIKQRDQSANRHISNSAQQNNNDNSKLDLSINLMKDLQITQGRNIALQKQNQKLIQQNQRILQENILIHKKFEDYKEICDKQRKDLQKTQIFSQHLSQKDQQIDRLYIRIQQLQQQGSNFLRKLGQKQNLGRQLQRKVRQLQQANFKITQQMKLDNQQRIRTLQRKIEQQRQSYQNSFRTYQDKIKQLQVLASNQVSRQQVHGLQNQITRLNKLLKQQKDTRREYQTKIKYQSQNKQGQKIKLQLINNQYQQKNDQLIKKNRLFQKQIQKLRDQNKQLINKSKRQEVSQRESSFMQIALDSTKNQNDLLKKNYNDLEKVYKRYQQSATQRTNELESQLANKQREIDQIRQQINKLKKQNEQLAQKYHQQSMKIRQQNLNLLQKIQFTGDKKGSQVQILKQQLSKKQTQIIQYKISFKTLQQKYQESRKQNKNLVSKVNKYKKQTKNQLRNINHTTVEELRRVHQEKQLLKKRVLELEQLIDTKKQQNQNNTSITYNGQDRKIGIKDQRKQLGQSRANTNSNTQSHFNFHNPQQQQLQNSNNFYQSIHHQLGQLRQLDAYIKNQQERLRKILGLTYNFQTNNNKNDYNQNQNGRSIFRAIRFFKEIQNKLRQVKQQSQQNNQAVKQLQFLKGRLMQLQSFKKQTREGIYNNQTNNNKNQRSSLLMNLTGNNNNADLMQFIRIQMKNQYKKLHQTLKLNQEKHMILKKKIYQEYRSRIISQLQNNTKDKERKITISNVQTTLERFIEGLSNLSHKQAVLAKEVRLKKDSRKEAAQLRQKLKQLTIMIQSKKGYCSRQPIRIWIPQNQQDWQDNLKLQAQLLTLDAQVHRLKEQLSLTKQALGSAKQEIQKSLIEQEEGQQQITKLKRQIIEIQSCCQKELQKIMKEKEELIRKNALLSNSSNTALNKKQKQKQKERQKDKQITQLKKQLQRKKDIIKDKQRKLIEYSQYSQRSQIKTSNGNGNFNNINDFASSSKRQTSQQNRLKYKIDQMVQNNRELRKQNHSYQQRIKFLEDQLAKKATYIKSLKTGDQQRIRTQKKQQADFEKLSKQIKELKQQIRKAKQQTDKIRKKKDRQIGALQDQLSGLKNQSKINQKSLESIIRALLDTLRKIYSALEISLKKKGFRVASSPEFQRLMSNPGDVDALQVYEHFEQPLNMLQSQ